MQHRQTRRTTRPSAFLPRVSEDRSQNSEATIILDYFSNMKLAGTVVSIGENDGETLSNVRPLLMRSNWHGLLYEPSPLPFVKLSRLYHGIDRVQCINKGVYDKEGMMGFHDSGSHLSPEDWGLLSTLLPEEKDRWAGTDFQDIMVDVIDAATIPPAHCYSIDAEGCDYLILSRLDLSLAMLVCVEFNGKDQDKFDALMFPKGFKLIHRNGENLIYAK